MPLKDKEKRNKASKTRMQKMRGVTKQGVTDEGVTWETIPLKDIKELLPDDIVAAIISLGAPYLTRERTITLEGRLRRAYKYQVWHDANLIDRVHKDSREFVAR